MIEIRMPCSMTHGYKTQRDKIEVLTANYPIAVDKPSELDAPETESTD
jgi:hypothetical protein